MKIIWRLFFLCIVLSDQLLGDVDLHMLRQRFWNSFYGNFPAPNESPISSRSAYYPPILLAVKIQNADFRKNDDGLVCRATIHLQISWSVQNNNVFKMKPFRDGPSLLLDESRIWTPKLEFENSRSIEFISSQLELRNVTTTKQHQGKFILTKGMNVEVLCESATVYYPFSTVFCPIHLKQGGLVNAIRWKEEDCCKATDEVAKKTSFLNVDKKYSKALDIEDFRHYLRVGICWREGNYLVRIFIPSSLIMIIAFASLWTKSMKIQVTSLSGCLLVLLILWMCSQLRSFSLITSIDIWFLICFITISMAFCLLLLMRSSKQKALEFDGESQMKDIMFESPESPRYILPNNVQDPYDTHTTGKDYNCRYQTTYRQSPKTGKQLDQKWTVAKVLLLILFIITITLYWIIILVMASTPIECSGNSRCKYAN